MKLPQAEQAEQTEKVSCHDPYDNYLHVLSDGTYLIDHKTLPYLFRFNFAALRKVRISKSPTVPPLAFEIFNFLQQKLTVVRFSEGGSYPNRMKYEEKVKFVVRAFNQYYSSQVKKERYSKSNQHYNRHSQIQFFSREEVRQHFLEIMPRALKRKKAENERKILALERHLETVIHLSLAEPQLARQIFKDKIQRKQLPWTDNMFLDIADFSRLLYVRFTDLTSKQRKRIRRQRPQQQDWEFSGGIESRGSEVKLEEMEQEWSEQELFESCEDSRSAGWKTEPPRSTHA